jgi:hypothetical protein
MTALEAYLEAAKRTPFAYGVMDCCLFVAGAIAAQTGSDPAAPYRGTYSTKREASAQYLRGRGVSGWMDCVLRGAGIERTDQPTEGDCACIVGPGRIVAGAVRWRGAWWCKTLTGLARFGDDQVRILAAWRVT